MVLPAVSSIIIVLLTKKKHYLHPVMWQQSPLCGIFHHLQLILVVWAISERALKYGIVFVTIAKPKNYNANTDFQLFFL